MTNAGSLKLRLFVAAALAISASLLIAGLSFYLIFQRYVERVALSELDNHFVQLVASIRIDDTGKIRARATLSDPRFQKPYGGRYWQINEQSQEPLRSRSLFDDTLPVPVVGEYQTVHIIKGPNNTTLFATEKAIRIPSSTSYERNLEITLAVDRAEIDATVKSFGHDLMIGLGFLYAALLGGSILQVQIGLRPLEAIRRGIEAISKGTSHKIEGKFPSEVHPLVEEVNTLLLAREEQLSRARLRASNLAHGLKTPLTVMSALADNIAAAGLKNEARDIHDGADQMRLLVERELARACMASSHSVQLTLVAPAVTRMVTALEKTAENDALLWHSNIPSASQIAMEPADFLELIGNLLDNARKWARRQIYVSWHQGVLAIDDDGMGVPDDQLVAVQTRGLRLDENVSGTGLGLGIVRDLCEVYGFDLKFKRSSLGGLSVSIDTRPKT